jgi:hypothetical protein
MDERSIQIVAHHLINRFGDQALEHVADCIEQAAEQDGDNAIPMWDRIYNAIYRWQRESSTSDQFSPIRVQLSRRPGWRKPDNTVVVSRPTIWGNPFPVGKLGREVALKRFREMLRDPAQMAAWWYPPLSEIQAKLGGKNLACWCALPAPNEADHCHAAILLEIANGPDEP